MTISLFVCLFIVFCASQSIFFSNVLLATKASLITKGNAAFSATVRSQRWLGLRLRAMAHSTRNELVSPGKLEFSLGGASFTRLGGDFYFGKLKRDYENATNS